MLELRTSLAAAMSPFTSEGDGLFTCSTTSLSEREVYAAFQDEHGDAIRDLTDDAKILFKVITAVPPLYIPMP